MEEPSRIGRSQEAYAHGVIAVKLKLIWHTVRENIQKIFPGGEVCGKSLTYTRWDCKTLQTEREAAKKLMNEM